MRCSGLKRSDPPIIGCLPPHDDGNQYGDGASASGKPRDFGSRIRRFESSRPSQYFFITSGTHTQGDRHARTNAHLFGKFEQEAGRGHLHEARHFRRQGQRGHLQRRRDEGGDQRERPRHGRLHHPAHVPARERPRDGAADHHRRPEARIGRPGHGGHPLLRLRAAGPQGRPADAHLGEARRRSHHRRPGRTASCRSTSTPARSRGSSTSPWTTSSPRPSC